MLRRAVTALVAVFVAVLVVAVPTAFAATSALTFSPRVVTVGQVPVGTTSEQAVTLTNSGSEALTLTSFEAFGFNGNFRVDPGTCTLGTILAVAQSCTFSVLTSPFVVGAIRGQFCYTGTGATTSDRQCGRIVGGAS